MTTDTTYNGWTNYETWAVKLWIDNDHGTQQYWFEAAQAAWDASGPNTPNQFLEPRSTARFAIDSHADNARVLLAERLEADHDSGSEHPVFAAAEGTVYADLLNAALSHVNWREIAAALLEDDLDLTDAVTADTEASS